MKNNLKQKNNLKNLEEIEKKINTEIFDEKIWIGEKMWKIAEVTYSYDSNQKINNKRVDLNFTLFCEIGGLDLKNFENLKDKEKIQKILKAKNILIKKINEKIKQIQNILILLKNLNLSKKEEIYKKEIIIEALEEKLNLFSYCLNGLPFELEKAGITQNLTKQEIKNLNEKQKKLDKILFGGQVSENQKEVEIIYKNLKKDFEMNKDKLEENEQIIYKNFLEKIKNILPEKTKEKPKKEKPKSLLNKIDNLKVNQDNYISYFQNSVNNIGGNYKILKNNEAGSISDGPISVEFPTKKEFQNLNLTRILRLEQHEILTHCLTDLNNSKILGNLRGAKSTEKDEGLAIFMENIFEFGEQLLKKDIKTGKFIFDLEKFNLPTNISGILVGEILDNKDLLTFLELQSKMGLLNNGIKDRFLRLKRSNLDGVQHKDTTYFRGLIKIIKEINKNILSNGKKGLYFYDFFIGKCSFENIKKMLYINKKANNGFFIRPNFSADKSLFTIENKIFENSAFLKFLSKKYPFINFLEKEIKNIKENILKIIKE